MASRSCSASSPADARSLLWSSIYDDNPGSIFFEHRLLYPVKEEVPDALEPIPLGKARVIREGTDVTVIATGPLVHRSLVAAEEAEKDGISVEVVDPRTLQPLDEEGLVDSVKKTNRVVVAHEAVTRMGFGAEVAAVLQEKAFDWLDAPIERVGTRVALLDSRSVGDGAVRRPPARRRPGGNQEDAREGLMADEVKLPRLGQGMETGTIVRWLKAEGDRVEQGEPLYEVDTDKATQEVEAEASGVLLAIAVAEGEVPVGQTVGVIGEPGESAAIESATLGPTRRSPSRLAPP